VRGKLVVFGGDHGPFDAWESSDRGSSWQKLPATGITGQLSAFGFCANREGSIFVIGGYDGSRYKAEVHRSDDGGRSWRLVHSGGSWSARSRLSAVCTARGELVLMGGHDGSKRLNDVWVSADGGSGWSLACASAPWSARQGHQSVCTADGAIVLLGGGDIFRCENDVWSSRDAGRTWICVVSAAPWAGRYRFGASVVGESRLGGDAAVARRAVGGRRECAVGGGHSHTHSDWRCRGAAGCASVRFCTDFALIAPSQTRPSSSLPAGISIVMISTTCGAARTAGGRG
jgi:hypothetical protein